MNILEGGGIIIMIIVILFGLLFLYILYKIVMNVTSNFDYSKMTNSINWSNGISYIKK